jgi:hypothetical protein
MICDTCFQHQNDLNIRAWINEGTCNIADCNMQDLFKAMSIWLSRILPYAYGFEEVLHMAGNESMLCSPKTPEDVLEEDQHVLTYAAAMYSQLQALGPASTSHICVVEIGAVNQSCQNGVPGGQMLPSPSRDDLQIHTYK